MSKLPITFQQGKAFLIVGDVPEKLSEKYFSGDQWKESNYFRKYREAISVLPRLEIVNPEAIEKHIKKITDIQNRRGIWINEIIDGEIYFVDGEYTIEEIETVEDGGGCFVAGVKTVARITLSNTTDQKNDAMSYTEASGTNVFVCPRTNQACFMSNCTHNGKIIHCGNTPESSGVPEEKPDAVSNIEQYLDLLDDDHFPKDRNDQINYFLVNILKSLDTEQATILTNNLIERLPMKADLESSREQYAIDVLLWALKSGWDREYIRLNPNYILQCYNQSLKESK